MGASINPRCIKIFRLAIMVCVKFAIKYSVLKLIRLKKMSHNVSHSHVSLLLNTVI